MRLMQLFILCISDGFTLGLTLTRRHLNSAEIGANCSSRTAAVGAAAAAFAAAREVRAAAGLATKARISATYPLSDSEGAHTILSGDPVSIWCYVVLSGGRG